MSLLSLQTVTKIFGGLTAVNEVSFDVEQGSIVSAGQMCIRDRRCST